MVFWVVGEMGICGVFESDFLDKLLLFSSCCDVSFFFYRVGMVLVGFFGLGCSSGLRGLRIVWVSGGVRVLVLLGVFRTVSVGS